jgi:uncharacterized protein YndB with AHSA1/START domain
LYSWRAFLMGLGLQSSFIASRGLIMTLPSFASAFNPTLDLQLICEVPITPEQAFRGWTEPDLLMQWFCPRPWKVVACQVDVRPGGAFSNVMQSPEGTNMPENVGSFLAVDAPRRLVWTNLMGADYRPAPVSSLGFGFVCELRLDPLPQGGTLYQATVRHVDEAGKRQHEDMGFEAGWRAALKQLVELMQHQP